MEVTRAQFARMCGVSKQSVSDNVKSGLLKLNSAKKIDTENPANSRYMTEKQKSLQTRIGKTSLQDDLVQQERTERLAAVTATAKLASEYRDSIAKTEGMAEKILSMTIRDAVKTYGGVDGMEKYAKILQILTAANEKDIRVQERRLQLISKDFVTSSLFGYIDSLMNKLLDYPDGAIDTIIAKVMAQKESARAECVSYMRAGLSKCICDAKNFVIGELNGLRGKYDDTNDTLQDIKESVSDMKEGIE